MATLIEAACVDGGVEARGYEATSLNAAWVACIVEALLAAGVHRAVLCPGGRASAMCLALEAHPRISVEMVSTDERSGAFIALGLAKASGEPVAIVTTSGSAIANVLPALTEADASDVPLVVLTCDRPVALRGAGFGQMADHLGATRAFMRAQADLDDPCDSVDAVVTMRERVARALTAMRGLVDVDEAQGMPRIDVLPSPHRATRGPVHVNVPLAGVYDAVETHAVSARTIDAARAAWALPLNARNATKHDIRGVVERMIARIQASRDTRPLSAGIDGLIVVGPEPAVPLDAIIALGEITGFPVIADAASGVRSHPRALTPDAAARGERGALIVNAFDVFGAGRLGRVHPELVIRFGLAPVLPALHAWFEAHGDAPTIRVSPQRIAHDYLHAGLDARDVLVAPSSQTLIELAHALRSALHGALQGDKSNASAVAFAWRDRWASVAAYAARERRACVDALAWGEVVATHRVFAAAGFAFVHLGNSMPMRHADIGYDVRGDAQHVYANRGVSGIDGTLSTFIGEVLARGDAGLLVLGDQSFVHDLSALAAAQRVTTPACVCVIDNGGGAIFDFLPVAREAGFRRSIRNPYTLDFGAIAAGFGIAHRRIEDRDALDGALHDARMHRGVTIVEVAVDAHSGVTQMQRLAHAVGAT